MRILSLSLVAAAAVVGAEPRSFETSVREFSAKRHTLAKELSEDLDLPLPREATDFFLAATTGRWHSVSNRFESLKETGAYSRAIPALRNELWAPVHETIGIWEIWEGWNRDSELLAMLHEPVLSSIPEGSIYFGGTDYGRFVITTANALKDPEPVYCITQNALADSIYPSHLRAVYGDRIWLPSKRDSARAFQRYVEEVRSGKRPKNAELKIVDGRVHVSGALGVMEINGILCEMIFEHNRNKHAFFVEESYVLNWMYPYLEPHGLIMKLNAKRLDKLSDEVVARDRQFWAGYEKRLMEHPRFGDNPEARKAFSKLRSAIAGLYAHHRMADEAEAAFRQAIRLCPVSPEASFRLAKLYEDAGRTDLALELMRDYVSRKPPHGLEKAEDYVAALEKRQPLTSEEEGEVEELIRQLGEGDAGMRRRARKKLESFGRRALPVLKRHAEARDPEVRITISEIAREIEESAGQGGGRFERE